MNGETTTARRGSKRRNFWINAAVMTLLLLVALFGVTQALILLAVYALVVLPA